MLTSVNVTNLAYKADITFDDYDCQLVSLAGRLYRIERKNGAFDMFLEIADISVGVSVSGDVPSWIENELEFRPMVSVTGIRSTMLLTYTRSGDGGAGGNVVEYPP